MKNILLVLLLVSTVGTKAQSLYFPPSTGIAWDTLAPESMGWCQQTVDSLYSFLETRNTNGFIILKNGKIVLEKYFGNFTKDSVNMWASAGKCLTAMLTGIAQEEDLFTINDTVSNILGNGWTSCTTSQEKQITVRHLLTMTSGLNDSPSGGCDNLDSNPACLQYFSAPDTRWAYHTGPYRKLENIISTAAGVSYNNYTQTRIGNTIGMSGLWVNSVFYSRVRDAARFGLLALNKGIWANDTLLHDTAYFSDMINTSQNYNLSYGYLWWLNGKTSYMAPGLQTVYTTPFFSNAPTDLIAALGKNDQKIYVVPSQNIVVVRLGNSAYGVASAFSPFDNELWGYISNLDCITAIEDIHNDKSRLLVYPNPASNKITYELNSAVVYESSLLDILGQRVYYSDTHQSDIDVSNLEKGIYFLRLKTSEGNLSKKIIKQ